MRWLAAAAAPWAVGLGVLVSFTASAGYESSLGSNAVARLVPRGMPPLPGRGLITPVSLNGTLRLALDAEPLRPDLKADARTRPLAQPALKGDALVPARVGGAVRPPSLTAGWLGSNGPSVASTFTPGAATWNPDLEPQEGFVPFAETGGEAGASSPAAGASAPTRGATAGGQTAPTRARDASREGTTPAVPRAVALSSTTPAPADATPVEIAAGGQISPRLDRDARTGVTTAARINPEAPPSEDARRRYADLITPENAEKEQRCLAEAVYFEARGEPEQGQAAVAQVVLNRAKSGLYPSNICGVVYQNRHRYMGCQFSFACEGKSLRITDDASWQTATRIAQSVVEGRTYLADVGGATHYHADYVKPRWSRRLRKMDVIGRHIFYQLRPGQT
ncbi:cell wall hydrolase [Methylobacterium nonmethylotrophicum]|uniref:Cell wall hydrolase n=1 Tax=Methylobacterium nonmethylotrophicum TaxID=1141884 RepID=A0A4Z0P015_9HYPH|nr:cell wall hydrolase [Methylobacterium nonmethylotrophicum]TGE02493.1 cell wall hydrolase [Methylobacterium nonmethylotrophicum]